MIDDVTVTAPNEPPPAATAGAPVVVDRAVLRAQARDLTRAAATRWLTTERTTQLGRAITVSITRYTRHHRQQPTWADALNGIDPTPYAPMTPAPTDWPLPAAAWRRDLRQRLMQQLSNEPAGSPTPRHPDRCASDPRDTPGSAPKTPPADDQPRRRHRRRGSHGQGITADSVVPNTCPGARRPPRRQRGDQWTSDSYPSRPHPDGVKHRLARPKRRRRPWFTRR